MAEQDADALGVFINSVQHAQTIDRTSVRNLAADQFNTARITDQVIDGIRIAIQLGIAAFGTEFTPVSK